MTTTNEVGYWRLPEGKLVKIRKCTYRGENVGDVGEYCWDVPDVGEPGENLGEVGEYDEWFAAGLVGL